MRRAWAAAVAALAFGVAFLVASVALGGEAERAGAERTPAVRLSSVAVVPKLAKDPAVARERAQARRAARRARRQRARRVAARRAAARERLAAATPPAPVEPAPVEPPVAAPVQPAPAPAPAPAPPPVSFDDSG